MINRGDDILEKHPNFLKMLKEKYKAEIDDLNEEEYKYLVTNYRFEGFTGFYIINFQYQISNFTILIINHDSKVDKQKYLGSVSISNTNHIEAFNKINSIIDENEELVPFKEDMLGFLKGQLEKNIKPQEIGKLRGFGTINRDSWYWWIFEGELKDISLVKFFSEAINEAKRMSLMKKNNEESIENRMMSVKKIQLVKSTDEKILLLLNQIKADLEKIKTSLPDYLINSLSEGSIIIENGALEKYGFSPDSSDGCGILQEILPIDNLTIEADLDSRRFRIQIRGLYGYLIEDVFHKYINDPDEIEKYIIEKINEFVISYKTQKFQYQILLPLNGIIAGNSESNVLEILFSDIAGLILFDNITIITKSSDYNVSRCIHTTIDGIDSGFNHALAIFCKGSIDFKFYEPNSFFFLKERTEPKSIKNNIIWDEVRDIFSSFILSNFKIGYSKQFYKFPWWIPKVRYQYDFPIPEWLRNVRYINPSQKLSIDRMKLFQMKELIPQTYHNITFPSTIDKKEIKTFKPGNILDGEGFFLVTQGISHEMSYQEINLKIPSNEYKILRNSYNIYRDPSYPINYQDSQFVIINLISLRLRERIEDAILDACMIIESLLLSGKHELSYQFKMHSSMLISSDFKEFNINLKFFNDLYNLRSKIVHGYEKWKDVYFDFINKNTRWNFNKTEWNQDNIEFTKREVLDLIFKKILKIIIRINQIGLSVNEFQKPHILIGNLRFNPQKIDWAKFNQEGKPTNESHENTKSKFLSTLSRTNQKLISIIEKDKLEPPIWYEDLKKAIYNLNNGNFKQFHIIYCGLKFKNWESIEDHKIIPSIIKNLEKIQEELCTKETKI